MAYLIGWYNVGTHFGTPDRPRSVDGVDYSVAVDV
jgi:hypothetical protein